MTNLPRMSASRSFHSSVIHDKKLYLIGGEYRYNGRASDFIDVLDLEHPHAWGILHEGQSLIRFGQAPLATAFSKDEILCAGGRLNGDLLSRVVTFNVRTQRIREHHVPSAIKFQCYTTPAVLAEGKIMALVVNLQNYLRIVEIDRQG